MVGESVDHSLADPFYMLMTHATLAGEEAELSRELGRW